MDKQRRIENILKVIESGGTSKDVKILNEMGSLEEKVNNLQQRFEEAISLIKEQNKSSYEVAETIAKNLLKDIKGEDGHTPTEEELMSLIEPLIPEAIDGHTPTTDELMNIIDPLFANLKKKYERDIIEKVSKNIPSEDDIISKVSKRLPKEDSIIKSVQDSIKLPSTDELINNLEERIPSLSAPIRDSLELLQEDDRLDKSAIKGLDDDFQLITDTFNKRLNIIATNKPLSEMIDVNVSGLKTNQALKWNGVEWVPYTPTDDKAIWGEITGDITDQTDLTTYISEQLATQDTLQEVTDNGATTTKDITAKSFITTGGTSSGFVKGDGSLDTTSYLPISTAISTYVPYTGATKDVNLGSNSLSLDKRISLENTTSSDTGVIYKGTAPFIHNFSHPTGSTAIPYGANTFVGLNSGNFTMGSTAISIYNSSFNTGIGAATLCSNTTGSYNTANGVFALCSNTTGRNNTASGMSALRSNTTGYFNTASGYNSGRFIADGTTPNETSNNSLYLGSNTKPLADGDTNEIVIGYNAVGAGSNTATLGNSSITKTILRGNVGVGTTTPSYTLDVAGTIRTARGSLTYDLIAGDYLNGGKILLTGKTGLSYSYIFDNSVGSYLSIKSNKAGANDFSIDADGNVGIGTTTPSQELDIIGDIELENTTSADTGVIYKGTSPFIHNFSHPTGDTAIPTGQNTFLGLNAGNFTMGSTATSVSQGSYNTGVGNCALCANTTGYRNSALGYGSLYSNTTGYHNTAIGMGSLYSNTTGCQNSSFGYYSLYNNLTGNYNSAFGTCSLGLNTSGSYNAAFGHYSLQSNTIGCYNTGLGFGTIQYNTTGCYNTAVGRSALNANTTGTQNSALGTNAGRYIADGSTVNETSNFSLYLGSDTKALADGDTNEIVIGHNAIGAGSNTATLGNSSITKTILRGNVGVGTTNPTNKLHVIGNNATTGLDFIALFQEPGITPEESAVLEGSNADRSIMVQGNGGAFYVGRDVTNDIEFAMGTSATGEAFAGAMTAHDMSLRTNNQKRLTVKSGTGYVGIGTTTPSQELSIVGDIELENTTSSDTGVIYKGTSPFIHNFSHPTGDTAIPIGCNTFVGLNAGNFTIGSTATSANHGSFNTGFGSNAIRLNTTGSFNSAVGYYSLGANSTGIYNSGLGFNALFNNSTGYYNTAIGSKSLFGNTTGSFNTASGYNSGRFIADGTTANATSNYSLYLGSNTKALADGDTNEIVIGYNAIGAGSNTATLGNTSITTTILRGNVKLPADNASLVLGAGGDASVYFDGTDLVINPKVVGSGGVNIAGFQYFTGDGLPYGDMFADDNSTATTISVVDTWYQIESFNTDVAENDADVDNTNDHITIGKTGKYFIAFNGDFHDGTVNNEYEIAVFKNNGATQLTGLKTHIMFDFATSEPQAVVQGIADLTSGDTIEVWVKNNTGGNNVTCVFANLTIFQLGG